MKKIILFLSIPLALFSCNKDSCIKEKNTIDSEILKDYYQDGVHVTIFKGTPFDTRAQGEGYNSYTVSGEKEGKTVTLYAIDTYKDRDFITTETFLPDRTKLCTSIYYHGKQASFVVNPDLAEMSFDRSPGTRSADGWEEYVECIEEACEHWDETSSDTAVERAFCEWFPCETLFVVVGAVKCIFE